MKSIITYILACAGVGAIIWIGGLSAAHLWADHLAYHELQVQVDTIGQLTELIRKAIVEQLHPDHFSEVTNVQ